MPAGRPKKKLDYELIGRLASIQCTQAEVASVLGVSLSKLDKDEEFKRIFFEKKEGGRASLRRQQWKLAESGNPTMLIWLGKQYLGQSDKKDVAHSGEQTVEVVVMPKDES